MSKREILLLLQELLQDVEVEVGYYSMVSGEKLHRAITAKLAARDPDEWIPWAGECGPGDTCPVADDLLVDVKFRDRSEHAATTAGTWCWHHDHSQWDIVAYRIAQGAGQ